MKNLLFLFFFITFSNLIFSQEKNVDSLKINQLNEVVLTAQIEPQSLKKSVHNVKNYFI